MSRIQPTDQEWRELFDASLVVRDLSPWDHLTGTDIFGVKDPESGMIGYVSVLGFGEQNRGIHVYRGPRGFESLFNFVEAGSQASDAQVFEAFLELDALILEFTDREMLTKRDLALIKRLGYRFRGRGAWPLFRSHVPGHAPWYLTAPEVRYLTLVLQQVKEVVEKYGSGLPPIAPDQEMSVLVRVPNAGPDGSLVWSEERVVPWEDLGGYSIQLAEEMQRVLSSLPISDSVLELDCFPSPEEVQDKAGDRPFFPYVCVVADSESGLVLDLEVVRPDPDLQHTRAAAIAVLVRVMADTGELPAKVLARHPDIVMMLEDLAEELGFEVKRSKRLRAVQIYRKQLEDMAGL